ncbi:hypothetical protein F4777DRAFT_583773 [Nemania sp. FL0916]|nr:hypothetical protein F4777DRAFT_583773 [Nemania sp. FL0916]
MSAITLQQIKDDPNRKDIFGVLNEYIQPDSTTSASQAASAFTQSVESTDEGFFWDFWYDVFAAAEQIPHAHAAQDKLATFVRELTLMPETSDKVWGSRVWTDLPLLGACIREHMDRPFESVSAHVSFHAFVARLLHAGVSPWSETTAIWMLREALETERGEPSREVRNIKNLDEDLAVAAMYIEYAGATLVQSLVLRPAPQPDDEAQRRSQSGGKLWGGGVDGDKSKTGLKPDRWTFWGQRFRALGDETKDKEVKELALHAAKLIEVWTQTRLPK